ncbi:uncharacterized protein LOC103702147 [Phoenix dactylifera]|uniref:Uncharacterized protein LOC103702147 n=1 Tax=Phoenix dactylifera TaxID=42345 RepID=A0A8B7BPB5_PHODC|nr:uncharacterized protein LOC103702147 [Phoenix dactylifera]
MDAVHRLTIFSSYPSLPFNHKPDSSFHPPVTTSNAPPSFVAARPPRPLTHRISTAWTRSGKPDSRASENRIQEEDPGPSKEGEDAARGGKEEQEEEELEGLEEEAMAGRDEGRAPTDYDRRAHIFSESSRIFRALKDRNGRPTTADSKNHRTE